MGSHGHLPNAIGNAIGNANAIARALTDTIESQKPAARDLVFDAIADSEFTPPPLDFALALIELIAAVRVQPIDVVSRDVAKTEHKKALRNLFRSVREVLE